jgi:hypothetical protein
MMQPTIAVEGDEKSGIEKCEIPWATRLLCFQTPENISI